MKRREFITLLGGAAAWPLAARAQQPKMPVIGYLSSRSSESDASMLVAFRRGLSETGHVEGQNVAIEYRFANGDYDRLPTLFTELTRQRVAVIVFAGLIGAEPVMQLVRTSQIPIVFNGGTGDPVQAGLVASFNRPGGNVTGINPLVGATAAKLLSLLRDLIPNATTIAALLDQASPGNTVWLQDAQTAAASLGLQLLVLSAHTESEISPAFASLTQRRPDALVVAPTPLFVVHAKLIAALAARHGVPAIYPRREFAEAGGLMSYGYDIADGYREMGRYAGRILKGDKPADLPVFQPTRFQFIINLKTARALGLAIPPTLLAVPDEVIE
jgi:putative ABC transport system substrate-binding protein